MITRIKRKSRKNKYKVAIAGCGRIASLLEDDPLREKPATHAGAFAAHPATCMIACCDINRDRLHLFAKRWGIRKLYTDYREMIDTEKIDILSVASWTETHSKIVEYAAESGVLGIYCEKPIAINLSQAGRMVEACEKNGVALVIGHERRWDRDFQIVKQMLCAGELGQLRSITGYTLSACPPKLSRRKYGGGALFHDGTHMVDLFRFFAGDPVCVIGLEERPNGKNYIENTVTGLVNFQNDVKGIIVGGGERSYFHFELDVQTDTARVLLGNHVSEMYACQASKRFTGFTELVKVPFPTGNGGVNPYVGGVSDLIREIETGQKSISSGVDGYKALETIIALYRSAGKGGASVKLPLRPGPA